MRPLLLGSFIAAALLAPARARTDGPAPAAPAAAAPERLLDGGTAWRAARWGMTAEEVLSAFQGQARRLDPAQQLPDGNSVELEVPSIPLDRLTFRAHFLFRGGKLARVSLRNLPASLAEAKDYDALRERLAAESGQAGEERPQATSIDYREIRFTSGGTAVDLKYLQGTLVLLYHPAAPAAAPAPATRPPG